MSDGLNDTAGTAPPNMEMQALLMQADALDGAAAAAGPEAMMAAHAEAEATMLADQNTGQVRMILALAVPLLGKLYPSLTAIYTDPTCDQVAGTLGPVLTKYGINLGDLGSQWGEEIAAVLVCGPIAVVTYQGIKADIQARADEVPKAVASAQPQRVTPPADPVTLG